MLQHRSFFLEFQSLFLLIDFLFYQALQDGRYGFLLDSRQIFKIKLGLDYQALRFFYFFLLAIYSITIVFALMSKMVISVKNLTKKFGNFTAVDDISFEVAEGEIVGLLGPNGAGKTTTIQMLLGVIEPTAGMVEILGKKMPADQIEILKQVNYSSTYVRLPSLLTVWENLYVAAMLYEVERPEEKIREVLKLFHSENLAVKLWRELSSGQATRVHLCKALINDPKILFLDEPTASLDPDIAQQVRNLLKRIRQEKKVTTFLTSHNMDEVEELCDRVLILSRGKIIAQGTPEDLAKQITRVKIKLMIVDGRKRFVSLANIYHWQVEIEGRYVKIEAEEEEIADILTTIVEAAINYKEISIEKPTLEDYFLWVLGEGA